jgi:hypothetical protein
MVVYKPRGASESGPDAGFRPIDAVPPGIRLRPMSPTRWNNSARHRRIAKLRAVGWGVLRCWSDPWTFDLLERAGLPVYAGAASFGQSGRADLIVPGWAADFITVVSRRIENGAMPDVSTVSLARVPRRAHEDDALLAAVKATTVLAGVEAAADLLLEARPARSRRPRTAKPAGSGPMLLVAV